MLLSQNLGLEFVTHDMNRYIKAKKFLEVGQKRRVFHPIFNRRYLITQANYY